MRNFQCILGDAFLLSQLSLFLFGYPTLSLAIHTVGVITVQTPDDPLQDTHRLELQCDRRNP